MRVREMHVLYRVRSDLAPTDGDNRLASPPEVAAFLRPVLEAEPVEVFGIICLTTKHRLIAWHELSRGTLHGTLVHPREVFKAAFLANAAGIVLAHNHPSGEPQPSAEDLVLTKRLVSAGELLGVEVLDHVIVGHDGTYYSLRETGTLRKEEV